MNKINFFEKKQKKILMVVENSVEKVERLKFINNHAKNTNGENSVNVAQTVE